MTLSDKFDPPYNTCSAIGKTVVRQVMQQSLQPLKQIFSVLQRVIKYLVIIKYVL